MLNRFLSDDSVREFKQHFISTKKAQNLEKNIHSLLNNPIENFKSLIIIAGICLNQIKLLKNPEMSLELIFKKIQNCEIFKEEVFFNQQKTTEYLANVYLFSAYDFYCDLLMDNQSHYLTALLFQSAFANHRLERTTEHCIYNKLPVDYVEGLLKINKVNLNLLKDILNILVNATNIEHLCTKLSMINNLLLQKEIEKIAQLFLDRPIILQKLLSSDSSFILEEILKLAKISVQEYAKKLKEYPKQNSLLLKLCLEILEKNPSLTTNAKLIATLSTLLPTPISKNNSSAEIQNSNKVEEIILQKSSNIASTEIVLTTYHPKAKEPAAYSLVKLLKNFGKIFAKNYSIPNEKNLLVKKPKM